MRTDKDRESTKLQMRKWRDDPANHAKELARNREYSKNNREKINAIVRRYRERQMLKPEYRVQQSANQRASYIRLRTRLFEMYGNICKCCGETQREFMELDHVNGGGKKHLTETSPITVYRQIIKLGKSPLYQLLCANCNRGRQRNGGVCPHQLKAPQLPT